MDRDLAAEFRAGNVRGLARAISLVEQRDPSVRHLLEELRDRFQRPRVLGFTGAPGTGKSTLVDALVSLLRDSVSPRRPDPAEEAALAAEPRRRPGGPPAGLAAVRVAGSAAVLPGDGELCPVIRQV